MPKQKKKGVKRETQMCKGTCIMIWLTTPTISGTVEKSFLDIILLCSGNFLSTISHSE